jgi:hypothetical protein
VKRALDPIEVAARLAELRQLFVPETLDEARNRLLRDDPDNVVELRFLDELARQARQR